MLWQLSIKNLAIIDDITIEFGDGFNVLTGETGAGKSIIIDAIGLILGGRADRDMIRSGENAAAVDAIFEIDENQALIDKLKEFDCYDEYEPQLLISRQIFANGRNVNRINGRPVTIGCLQDISQYLIDVHGQHQHQTLLNKAFHRGLLDSFGQGIAPILQQTKALYEQWRSLCIKISEIEKSAEDFEKNRELLEYQMNEIFDAELIEGEDDELLEKKQLMKNSENITDSLEAAVKYLNDGRRDAEGALDLLRATAEKLRHIANLTQEYEQLHEAADSLYYEAEDLSDSLHKALRHVEYSPEKLEIIEERLYLIHSLKRKYGKTIEEVMQYGISIQQKLKDMDFNMSNLDQLKQEESEASQKLQDACNQLHQLRIAAAKILESRIVEELSGLGMKNVQFSVEITPSDSITQYGADNVEFFISTNPGEPMKPLAKIASGGEVSRIMLSIKSALADADQIPTLIFDEIDTGISGQTARAAGVKMKAISKNHQVICVTHSAQIASLADQHFYVSKTQDIGKTKTHVDLISGEEREKHIAEMISGSVVTKAALEHARELIQGNAEK